MLQDAEAYKAFCSLQEMGLTRGREEAVAALLLRSGGSIEHVLDQLV